MEAYGGCLNCGARLAWYVLDIHYQGQTSTLANSSVISSRSQPIYGLSPPKVDSSIPDAKLLSKFFNDV